MFLWLFEIVEVNGGLAEHFAQQPQIIVAPGRIFEAILIALVIGVFGFMGWLWKRSIYGEMEKLMAEMGRLDARAKTDIDKVAVGISEIKKETVMTSTCLSLRDSCGRIQIEQLTHISTMIKLNGDRLTLLIERFDRHMNGVHDHLKVDK